MARLIDQPLPDPPKQYDQAYFYRLVNAVNLFMLQSTAQAKGETIAANFICTAPVTVDPTGAASGSVPSTQGLPTGLLYLTAAADTGSGLYFQAWATGNITLTTSPQNIPGCSVTVERDGDYLVMGTFDFYSANEQGAYLYGQSNLSSHKAVCDTSSNTGRFTVSQQAIGPANAGDTIQLTAYKTGGNSNSATMPECSLTVVWLGGASGAPQNFFTIVGTSDP